MSVYKRFAPNLQSAFSIVIMVAVWLTFAPRQVGGMASYIVVIGNSMEPAFHIGDLIIAHREPTYQIGDAIVYQNRQLKSFVFHRVISQEMGYFTLKGDNNSWIDIYQPSYEEVVGKLWLHIPRGGVIIQKIRSPFVMALLAGALGAVFASSIFRKKTGGSQPMKDKSMREWLSSLSQKTRNLIKKINMPEPKKPSNRESGEILEGTFFILGLIALASLILGIISFSRPISRIRQDELTYEHLGIFSYSASTPQDVYDESTLRSGDPIFTKLICEVDVHFQYTLVAAQADNIIGTYQLTATISEPTTGWQRTIPLQEQTPFNGSTFGSTTRLDLCQISALIESMEQKTDAHSSSYILGIAPGIQLNGKISGRELQSTYVPKLNFRYDRAQFYLVRNEEQENPLVLAETRILREEKEEANVMFLFGREMAIPTLRMTALVGFSLSSLGIVLLGLRVQNLSRFDQVKFFRIKYESLLIDIENTNSITASGVTDVISMEALAKLAERFNAMILHAEQDDRNCYYVQAGGITYRFMINVDKTGSALSGRMNHES
jgi:signal peptidase I